ncbi:RHS repeat-associated protein [Tahibacter aquaticus]|uniref:RHS repeat-associated protein n=1 Tax=Tahibacter aquaticus TaxID=520092 RepID=A0A4R6YF36_9GAMM|nr:RHS repeat-associated core domain-containing protein [Tahibacter aquaticus]TDR34785.1 RHS repeat-associated protein [Tahibacter aquaticus]
MGEPLKAEAIVKHFACIVSPSIAATPFGSRQVFGTAAVTFAVTLMPAFQTYGNSAPLFLKRSTAMMPTGMTFKPDEYLPNNPVEHSYATSHGHMGKIRFPNGGIVPGAINCGVLPGPNADCSAELEGLLEAIAERMAAEFKANPLKFFAQYKEASALATANALGETAKGWWDTISGAAVAVGGAIKDGAVASYDYVSTHSVSEMASDAASGAQAAYDGAVQWTSDAIEYVAEGIDALSELSLDDVKQIFKEWLREVLGELGCSLRDALAQMATDPRPMAVQLGEIDGMATAFALETAGAVLVDTFVTKGAMSAASKIGRIAGKVGPKLGSLVTKFKNRIAARRAPKLPDHPSKKPDLPKPKPTPDAPEKVPDKTPDKDAVKGDEFGKGLPNCLICPTGGRPVNTIYGCKLLDGDEDLDFSIDGPLPLHWQRTYVSSNASDGWLGQGWSLPIACRLEVEGQSIVYVDTQARRVRFPVLGVGESFFSPYEQTTLRRTERNQYELLLTDGLRLIFALSPSDYLQQADVQAVEERQAAQFSQALQQLRDTSANSGQKTELKRSNVLPQAERLVMLGWIDPNGNWMRVHYSSDDLPQVVETSVGRRIGLTFSPEAGKGHAARLIRIVELLGEPDNEGRFAQSRTFVEYRYSDTGDLVAVLDDNHQLVRTFAWHNHIMIEHGQPGGVVSRYEWDHASPTGRVRRNWLSTGETFTFDYDESNGRNRVTDATGRTTTFCYDDNKYLVAVVDAAGGETRFTRDIYGNVIERTDPMGRKTRHTYNGEGKLSALELPDGSAFRIAYDEVSGRVAAVSDPLQRTIRYRYDARGNLTEIIQPDASSIVYRLNERGLPTAIVDASGATSLLEFDAASRLRSRQDCLGQATTMEYDAYGNLLKISDAAGGATHYRYERINRRDRVIAITYPDGSTERMAYDALGRLIAHQNPLGQAIRYQLDGDGKPTRRENALGDSLSYQYDVHGRLIALTNENGAVHRFAWDDLDRLVAELGFDGRRQDYAYNPAGELVESADGVPAGASLMGRNSAAVLRTRYERDLLGRLLTKTSCKPRLGEKPLVARSRFRYDDAGQLIQARNANACVELFYTQGGRVAREISRTRAGLSTVLAHEYDVQGNRVATTLPDGRRLESKVYGSGHVHRIELDGEIVSEFERDRLHRETVRSQGALCSFYEHDAVGRLLASRAVERDSLSHAAAGMGQRISRQYRYDRAGQLDSVVDARNGPSRYEYDGAGQLLAAHSAQFDERFAFDPAGNLTDSTRLEETDAVTPDDGMSEQQWRDFVAANIERRDFSPLQARHVDQGPAGWGVVRPNRLRVHQQHRYQYDSWGNCIEKKSGAHEVRIFGWDAEHQLAYARVRTLRGVEDWRYEYDPFGRRIAKYRLVAGNASSLESPPRRFEGSSQFSWDGNRLLLERSGTRQKLYLYETGSFTPLALVHSTVAPAPKVEEPALPLEMLSLKDRYPRQWAEIEQRRKKMLDKMGMPESQPKTKYACEIFYVHADHLGTPRELTDEAGCIVWAATYKAWGGVSSLDRPERIRIRQVGNTLQRHLVDADPIEYNLRFAGQYFDAEHGLHYNRFRYYDPDIGRFVSQDPIGLGGGTNAYVYAPNPIVWTDVLGLARCAKMILGRKVYQDDSLIDSAGKVKDMNLDLTALNSPSFDKLKGLINGGATNVDLMAAGYAPFGLDGKQVNLHHVIGAEPGPMVELSGSTHQRLNGPLHGLIEDGRSFRNDPKKAGAYERFRKKYWKERAKNFGCP